MNETSKFIVHPRKPAVGKSTVISVRIPDKMIKSLDELASDTGRTRNELILKCIDYALSNLEIAED